jgi:hypothetical protein
MTVWLKNKTCAGPCGNCFLGKSTAIADWELRSFKRLQSEYSEKVFRLGSTFLSKNPLPRNRAVSICGRLFLFRLSCEHSIRQPEPSLDPLRRVAEILPIWRRRTPAANEFLQIDLRAVETEKPRNRGQVPDGTFPFVASDSLRYTS